MHSLEFIPHPSFKSLFQEADAQKIWALLKERDNVIRAETAVYLNKAPVEALTPELLRLDTFSKGCNKQRTDRLKQLIGSYVRYIMEARGYDIDEERRHRLKAGTESQPSLFKTSAVYVKRIENND
ncbi:conserved hypothetical protein [Psychromonas ingrahamii 37]|uniref:Uncharacterized protein n=2 Tax=Psychromonas ingrahamii TaxID=357794 RepID=A1SXR5_PSYIN|nr:conserved hypothetical protein [Psychromonas ingrahamii 37]